VLDVGFGHGLLLIAAAKLLPRGHAVGIDLWSQVDQSNNSREVTLRNAALEGVTQRVRVRDGDVCKLPFADRSFDATVAHFAIHIVLTREGRREAIREFVRTLNHGGQVAISDMGVVGVGIMVAHDPLRGSGRAVLPHPALALGDDAQAVQRVGMINAQRGQPAVNQPPHSVPVHVTVLTASR